MTSSRTNHDEHPGLPVNSGASGPDAKVLFEWMGGVWQLAACLSPDLDVMAMLKSRIAEDLQTLAQVMAGEAAAPAAIKLRPSRERAYGLYKLAVEQGDGVTTYEQAYAWLSGREEYAVQLSDFGKFKQYAREAMRVYEGPKQRPHVTRSIVNQDREASEESRAEDLVE